MNDTKVREMLATGEAFVTTLAVVRAIRDRAVAAEREACAKIAREQACVGVEAAIRARGKK